MKIVFPDRIDLDDKAVDRFKQLDVEMYDDTPGNEDVIIERIKDAEIITANFINITKRIIDSSPKLKYIIASATGYEWIDYEYAKTKGIKVLNCPTQNVEAVAEHAVALMLAVAHRIVEANSDLANGNWSQQDLPGIEITNKKLGLVGYGRVGKLIEKKVSGFSMKISHVNSKSSPEELDELLRSSDIVCLCLPLNKETKDLIDKRRVNLLTEDVILVNVARGALVDQDALYEALQNRNIRGAGLDVYRNEPFTGKPIDSIVEIAKLPNVVATPHMAFNTHETTERLGAELYENVQSCINSNPNNVVNN